MVGNQIPITKIAMKKIVSLFRRKKSLLMCHNIYVIGT